MERGGGRGKEKRGEVRERGRKGKREKGALLNEHPQYNGPF